MNLHGSGVISKRWETLRATRSEMLDRAKRYARWTLPHICPEEETTGDKSNYQQLVTVGPTVVNHLANRLVTTLFPPDRPFFTILPTIAAEDQIREEATPDEAEQILSMLSTEASTVERRAMRLLNMVTYRPSATAAAKGLIITGNTVIYKLPDGSRVVYGLKDFVVVRDLSGKPIELILRDCKKLETLPEHIRAAMQSQHPSKTATRSSQDVKLYTHCKLQAGGKWYVQQAVDELELEKVSTFTKENFPYLVLTWNLSKGDNYGRGLVEDNEALFHVAEQSTAALLAALAVTTDIKFLVDPGSLLDVAELNESESGTYHSGREGDISTVKLDRHMEIEQLRNTVAEYERRLSEAFLRTSGTVRQAERVTAEEIRYMANELETAYGGIYSQFAADWQLPEAQSLLVQMKFDLTEFDATVVTGIESMSRTGQMDNLRLFMSDMAMLNDMPEEFRSVIHPMRFAAWSAGNRQVLHRAFLKTDDEIKQEQQELQQQQKDLIAQQGISNVATEAGKSVVKEQNG